MINLLFDPLPECVQVDGVDYPVVTDFRDWIAFADLILDPGISPQNKVAAAMQWYPDARPPDATKALRALKWFFTAEPLLTGRQQRRMGGRPTGRCCPTARTQPTFWGHSASATAWI